MKTSIAAPLTAYALTSMVGDCRVTQVVDIRKGVHCMIPKRVFVNYPHKAQTTG
jgi:acetamidase/formamidase